MPVKIKVSSGGRTLIQSLSSLSIEGTVIFGKKYPPQDANDIHPENSKSDGHLPDNIQQETDF
jgi:hypothetical protein